MAYRDNKYINNIIYQTYNILYTKTEKWFDKKYENIRNNIVELIKILYNKYKKEYTQISKDDFDKVIDYTNKRINPKFFKDTIPFNTWVHLFLD